MVYSLKKWRGEVLTTFDFNGIHDFMLNTQANMLWDGITATSQTNYVMDKFTSDNAQSYTFMTYNASNDNYETFDVSAISTDYYVDIYTTSTTGISALAINNCTTQLISYDGTTYVYRMWSTSVDAEVQRAEVMKTLFYGTNATDYKVTGITGLTNLKSSDSRDVGKRAHLARNFEPATFNTNGTADYLGTFANTTTNTDCQVWSFVSASLSGGGGSATATVQFPNGTTVNSVSASSTSDETGTDTSADNQNNPADVELSTSYTTSSSTAGATTRALVLCVGDITWAATTTGNPGTQDNQDFFTTHSIPDFEAATISIGSAILITESNTVSNPGHIFPFSDTTIDAANSVTVEFTADGTNYQTISTERELQAVTATGTTGWFRFTITRTDNTVIDTINGLFYFHE